MNHAHEMLANDEIQDNLDNMMSYENMRNTLLPILAKSRGQKRIYLEQILDVMDLACEMVRNNTNQEEIEAEIYSILS